MNLPLKTAVALTTMALATQAMAQITLYKDDGWRGNAYTASGPVTDLGRVGFNDRASSVVVEGGRWEVCEDARFGGRCMTLRRGSYESLSGMGMNDRISSVRPVPRRDRYDNEAPAPLPQASYEYRQRPNERMYEAQVTSVRAVVGPPEERCWVERQQVSEQNNNRGNVGGAIAGALLGGVLGHQVGGGTGRDIATAGGAVAGAALGSNMANNSNNGNGSYARDVRRCENTASTTPQYWDVTYTYRGIVHRVQLASAPGQTIPVNRDGLPRL